MIKYFFDANYLIKLLDKKHTNHSEIYDDFIQKQAESHEFYMTELVRYEVIRGIKWNNVEEKELYETVLKEYFHFVEIKKSIIDLAIKLHQLHSFQHQDKLPSEKCKLCKQVIMTNKINVDKRRFDMFHFATAKVYGYQMVSGDKGINLTLEKLYQDLKNFQAA